MTACVNLESRPISNNHLPDKQLSPPNDSYQDFAAVQTEPSVDISNDSPPYLHVGLTDLDILKTMMNFSCYSKSESIRSALLLGLIAFRSILLSERSIQELARTLSTDRFSIHHGGSEFNLSSTYA